MVLVSLGWVEAGSDLVDDGMFKAMYGVSGSSDVVLHDEPNFVDYLGAEGTEGGLAGAAPDDGSCALHDWRRYHEPGFVVYLIAHEKSCDHMRQVDVAVPDHDATRHQ
jgi:hypothetical protein